MKTNALMIPDPITIGEDASIQEAIETMKVNSIRHLPVVSADKKLVGFVTLADLTSRIADRSHEPSAVDRRYAVVGAGPGEARGVRQRASHSIERRRDEPQRITNRPQRIQGGLDPDARDHDLNAERRVGHGPSNRGTDESNTHTRRAASLAGNRTPC